VLAFFFLTRVDPILQSNILIRRSGRACIADFDMSMLSNDSRLPLKLTQSDRQRGSIYFLAPELLIDSDDSQSCRGTLECDIYAYACVCYEVSSILFAVSFANIQPGVHGKTSFFKFKK
jgi:serine/threonine protein kinase